jgi:hypothetical protein
MASPMTIDYLYQRIIVSGLDGEFIARMQQTSRAAMLPPFQG